MSTPNKVLEALTGTNEYVTLAITVAGELVPLGKALVKEIRAIAAGGQTISYEVLLKTDAAELDAIDKLSLDDIAAINEQLTKLGLPQISVTLPGPAADPAPGTSGA